MKLAEFSYSTDWQDDCEYGELVKDVERSCYGLSEGSISAILYHAWKNSEKPQESSVSMAGLWAKNQTCNFPIAKQIANYSGTKYGAWCVLHINIHAKTHNPCQPTGIITLRVLVILKPSPSGKVYVSYSWCALILVYFQLETVAAAVKEKSIPQDYISQLEEKLEKKLGEMPEKVNTEDSFSQVQALFNEISTNLFSRKIYYFCHYVCVH